MNLCIACMKCRPDGKCVQPEDDAHIIGRKIKDADGRGAIRAVRGVLHYGGYKIIGKIVRPGARKNPKIPQKLLDKAKSVGLRF